MTTRTSQIIWGIDLGGTKIEGIILSFKEEIKVIHRQRIPTEAIKGYAHVLQQIKKLVQMMSNVTGYSPQMIGIGTPGSLDPDSQLLKNSNSTHLNGKAILNDLQELLQIPVCIANDANCFALAETKLGIVPDLAPHASVVFGVILGTGVGGGIVINGNLLAGRHGIAGEWGHNFLDESGGQCYCGKSGCVETVLAGPSLEAYYERISNEKRPLKEIVMKARLGEPAAKATMSRLTNLFGRGIGQIINIIDPDIIVVGGGVGNIEFIYDEGVKAIGSYVFNTHFNTPIVKPKLGDSAGVFGAAMLVAHPQNEISFH